MRVLTWLILILILGEAFYDSTFVWQLNGANFRIRPEKLLYSRNFQGGINNRDRCHFFEIREAGAPIRSAAAELRLFPLIDVAGDRALRRPRRIDGLIYQVRRSGDFLLVAVGRYFSFSYLLICVICGRLLDTMSSDCGNQKFICAVKKDQRFAVIPLSTALAARLAISHSWTAQHPGWCVPTTPSLTALRGQLAWRAAWGQTRKNPKRTRSQSPKIRNHCIRFESEIERECSSL